MEFNRLQRLLTKGQFIERRHDVITDEIFDYVENEQLKLKKKDRKNYPTKADMYYQLIIEGLKHADKVTFKNLPNDKYKVRMKLGNPINAQLFEVRSKLECKTDIFSFAVCLMEAAIDNQTK